MSQTKKDRLSTYQSTYRDHYKKKRRLAMGMSRRAEWSMWHADPPAELVPVLSARPPSPSSKFGQTRVGFDPRTGVPLVDNRSGLGLGLGLHSGAKASLLQFRAAQHAELLRYDPSVARFAVGLGSDSQRAAPLYNTTRARASTAMSARRQAIGSGEGVAEALSGGGGGGSDAFLFPRDPRDALPLSRPESLAPSYQTFRTSAALTQMAGVGGTTARPASFNDYTPSSQQLPPIVSPRSHTQRYAPHTQSAR